MAGKFIVIEGANGSGKSTLVKNLTEKLLTEGYPVVAMKFPQYGKKSCGPVEEYLAGKYGDLVAVGPYRGSIFYAVDRFDASFEIRKHLSEEKIIICDRYMAANMAHQGCEISDLGERRKYYEWLKDLEFNIFGIPKPDANVIMDIPYELSFELVQKRAETQGKDIHELDIEYHRSTAEVYLELVDLLPNVHLFKGAPNGQMYNPEEMTQKVFEYLKENGVL